MINSNSKPTIKQTNSKIIWFSFISGITFLFAGFVILVFIVNSQKDVFPNKTTLSDVDISLLSKNEAKDKIKNSLGEKKDFAITLGAQQQQESSNSSQLEFKYLIDESIEEAFIKSHNDLTLKKPLRLYSALFVNKAFLLRNEINHKKVEELVSFFSDQVDTKGHLPFATLEESEKISSLELDPGKLGLEINQEKLIKKINKAFKEKKDYKEFSFSSSPQESHHQLNKEDQENALKRASLFVGQNILLANNGYRDVKLEINDQELIESLSFPEGINESKTKDLMQKLDNEVKRDSKDAIFDYQEDDDGNFIVNEFVPHLDGLKINKDELQNKLQEVIKSVDNINNTPEEIKTINLDLPLDVIKPKITLDQTNEFGIKELIGFGDSEYDHSIPNRIWNVSLTSEKMNNILVAPGEEFRFNNTLGEVSRRTGFRSAYIISGGKTVLGDGGGVCQVSTTYFRAILNAGLEVTKRKSHSYRVSYYELNKKPGIDATVYSGDVDLRFKNDTDHHVLIRSSADSDELYMKVEIYGTSDGRTAEIVDHKTWGERGAPASAYYPTTELPPGVTKQIDWAVSGIKASFKNVVKDKDGETISEEEYYSNYVPWSAKYLIGV